MTKSARRCLVFRSAGHRASAGLLLAVVVLAALGGCAAGWQADVARPDGTLLVVNRHLLDRLAGDEQDSDEQTPGLAVDRVLYEAGYPAVERLVVTSPGGARQELDWAAVAADAWWQRDGRLLVNGQPLAVQRLEAQSPALAGRAQAGLVDVAPTAAAALGLPIPSGASGRPLTEERAGHVVLLFLDGLGYARYGEALAAGLVPNLAGLGEPLVAVSIYPPTTSVATAALLTGAPPQVNGVDRKGVRSTMLETLFQVAAAAWRRVVAVEGESLPFNLPGAEIKLSGDRDGNDSTDDNVLANALGVIEGGLPDLLWVHLHGIDDAGHTYGPGTPEECERVRAVDAAAGQIVAALPPGTLVLAFADHGQHVVAEDERLGNHGQLVERDMFVPLWVVFK